MSIRKPNTFPRHLIQAGSLVGRFRVVTGEVTIPKIVGVDNNNIGKTFSGRNLPTEQPTTQGDQGSEQWA
jgi:hypothetical protein